VVEEVFSLSMSVLPASKGTGMKGTLIWFNTEKGHGYIRTDDGQRLLVEESGFEPGHVLGDRCAGTPVSFEREPATGDRDARAVGVTVVSVEPARRARIRRR
jgi:cold shock CspA family protein